MDGPEGRCGGNCFRSPEVITEDDSTLLFFQLPNLYYKRMEEVWYCNSPELGPRGLEIECLEIECLGNFLRLCPHLQNGNNYSLSKLKWVICKL